MAAIYLEELGFIGAMILLVLFAALLWRLLVAGWRSKDPFGMMFASGLASMILFQLVVNLGMVIGIMPITGIPLPFISPRRRVADQPRGRSRHRPEHQHPPDARRVVSGRTSGLERLAEQAAGAASRRAVGLGAGPAAALAGHVDLVAVRPADRHPVEPLEVVEIAPGDLADRPAGEAPEVEDAARRIARRRPGGADGPPSPHLRRGAHRSRWPARGAPRPVPGHRLRRPACAPPAMGAGLGAPAGGSARPKI